VEVRAMESGFMVKDKDTGKSYSAYTLPGVLSIVSPQF